MAGRSAACSAEAGHHRRSDSPVAALQRNGGEAAQVAGGGLPPCRSPSDRDYSASATSPLDVGCCPGT